MACRAIGVHVVFGMATDAKRHLDGAERFGKRERHFGYVPVARKACDLSDGRMPPVRKIGVFGHPVDLFPWDGLPFLDVFHQFFLLFALRHRLFVASLADFDVRDRGLFMGEHPLVAIEAVQACILEVLFMIILYGLRIITAAGTTGQNEKRQDRQGYGTAIGTHFHKSSKGLRDFLPIDVAKIAGIAGAITDMVFYPEQERVSILF